MQIILLVHTATVIGFVQSRRRAGLQKFRRQRRRTNYDRWVRLRAWGSTGLERAVFALGKPVRRRRRQQIVDRRSGVTVQNRSPWQCEPAILLA